VGEAKSSPRMARWAMAAAFGASIGCAVTLFLHGHDSALAASSAAQQPPLLAQQTPQSCGVTLTPLGSECSAESKHFSRFETEAGSKDSISDSIRQKRSNPVRTPALRAPQAATPELLHDSSTAPGIRVPTSLHPRLNPLLTSEQVFQ
jgi:hypothetical protein